LNKWLEDKKTTQFYGLLATFIHSFKIEDILDIIDKPDNEQFIKLLETNDLYAPSKEFFNLTPIYVFRQWLLRNLYIRQLI